MDMTITKGQRDLLIGLAGILIAVVVNFLVASPYNEKTASIESKNKELKPIAEEYQAIHANVDEYEEKISEMKQEGQEILSHYPSGIEREDQLMLWANIGGSYPDALALGDIELEEWDAVAIQGIEEGEIPAAQITYDEDGNPKISDDLAKSASADYKLFAGVSAMEFASTYDGLKYMLTYIQSQNDRNSIDALEIEYDEETGFLKGAVGVRQYYVLGTDKEYMPTFIPSVLTGVDDIFHSGNGNLSDEKEENPERDE
ncbi:MAG: hypothetical protein KBS96_05755 [Lachnospiraceae bacterium]|nr:hypothetical protein [Candidatus Colinaster scatohippi]